MKRLFSILLLALISLSAFSQFDKVNTLKQDPIEICNSINHIMDSVFGAHTMKTVEGDYCVSMFEREDEKYSVDYRVKFQVCRSYFFYDIEYTINSEIDPYDYDENEVMYYEIRQDLLYIQKIVQSIE